VKAQNWPEKIMTQLNFIVSCRYERPCVVTYYLYGKSRSFIRYQLISQT